MSMVGPNSPQPQVVLTGPTPNNSQEAQDERVLHATPSLEEVATPQAEVVQPIAGDVPPSPLDIPRTASQRGLRLSVPQQESQSRPTRLLTPPPLRRSPRLVSPPPLRRSPRLVSPSPNGGTKRKGSPTSGEDGGSAKKVKFDGIYIDKL
jgi:hypothetical protein